MTNEHDCDARMTTAILDDGPLRSWRKPAPADHDPTARRRHVTQMRALIAIAISVSLASGSIFAAPVGALRPGEFVWEPELSPRGPLVILVRTQGQTTLEDLAKRVRVTPWLLEKLYDLLAPGTTIVVTDAPALHGSPKARSIFVMESVMGPNASSPAEAGAEGD